MAQTEATGPRIVVVTGDVTTDWNLATIDRGSEDEPASTGASAAWGAEEATQALRQPGGVVLLGDLIKEIATPLGFTVREVGEKVRKMERGLRHSYAVWSLFPFARDEGGDAKRVWRVEKFLGLDPREQKEGDQGKGLEAVVGWTQSIADLAPDLVILDDAGLGFRDNKTLWPRVVLDPPSGRPPWVLLKMAGPIAEGDLFENLVGICPERLIVVMRINDLRQSEVRISRELSWERTAEDLLWELTYNPGVKALSRCAHVVVSIETAGAMLLSSTTTTEGGAVEEPPSAVLFYDPKFIESEWARQHPGRMIGSTSCLAAGVAHQIMLHSDDPDLRLGIQRGVAAMRELHKTGWGEGPAEDLAFPATDTADVLAGKGEPLAEIEVAPSPVGSLLRPGGTDEIPRTRFWTILEECCKSRSQEAVARDVARTGVGTTLLGVPVGRFGKLTTVDRQEMEGLRSISALIHEYKRQRGSQPLSIAVFGPPGSGKSFGVKQVAKSLLHDEFAELTFNLSQFNDPTELHGALHQVRDKCLEGTVPLVFWDEFDSTFRGDKLGWLRHFLVPMQDGTFQQGEITHPIGRAIFVFAGGIYRSMERFRSPQGKDQEELFKRAKGRDFLSRLKGFVDIVGPDPRAGDLEKDPHFRVRRAILLRSILLRDRPHLFRKDGDGEPALRIDRGVLRGFLQTRKYRHGVRSMESIVAMSTLSGKSQYERSALPDDAQLDLHVDAKDFLAWVQGPDVLVETEPSDKPGEEGDLERFAEAVHVVYCEELLRDGYSWAAPTNEYLLRHSLLRPFVELIDDRRVAVDAKTNDALIAYKDLPPHRKEQNRENARDIPRKLARAGYVMRPARTDDELVEFSHEEIESLSEEEHERWMWQVLKAGWRWGPGPKKDEEKKENPAILPWSKLSDEEKRARYGAYAQCVGDDELSEGVKDWDRALVVGIPKILAVAGYTVAKHAPEDTGEEKDRDLALP